MLGIKEIKEIIPHRHPFLLVDCIEELEPGVRAVGYKAVTYNEPYFSGHFPAYSNSGILDVHYKITAQCRYHSNTATRNKSEIFQMLFNLRTAADAFYYIFFSGICQNQRHH